VSLLHCIAARDEVEADSVVSVARTRVYFATPRDNGNEVAAAAGTAVEAVVEAAVEAVVDVAVDKQQVVTRNLIDNAVDIAVGVTVRNSGGGNPASYIAPTVHIPAAVAPAGERWVCDPLSPVRQKRLT